MSFLGIDIGSSSIKAGVLEIDDDPPRVRRVLSAPFPNPVDGLPPSRFEIDVASVVRASRDLLEELASECHVLQGIVASCQMGGVVLADAAGKAVTNYLSWRDQRTLDLNASNRGQGTFLADVKDRTTEEDWRCLGHELKPGSAAALLYWLVANGALPNKARQAMSLGDYVLARLCESPARAHPTLALGLVDLSTGDWRREWFARLGFGELLWPPLVPTSEAVGAITLAGRAIPCYPAVGDHQAALHGAQLRQGELSINVSTGSQVSMTTESFQPGDYQSRPFFGGSFLNTITHLPAGRSLSALVELLGSLAAAEGYPLRDPWGAICREVTKTSATDLEVDLAFFASSVGDCGRVANIRLENLAVGPLFRAAFENMANNYRASALRLSPKGEWTRLVLSGGLCQKLPPLRDLILSRFDAPYRMVDATEETLLGLARLARTCR